MMDSLHRRRQQGQMLVGVMVLLAIVFLLGSAMALGVSGSLHQVDQGATQDAARYAAESAVSRGQSALQSGSLPTTDICGPLANVGSLNGQAMQARTCYITAVDAGAGKVRYSSQGETQLGKGDCLSVPLNGGTAPRPSGTDQQGNNLNGSSTDRVGQVWTNIAWRSPGGSPANLVVFVDDETGCDLTDEDKVIGCAASAVVPPVYMHCAYQMAADKPNYMLSVLNLGGPVIVSDFTVRDAAAGHDCAATVVGKSQTAADEGDLVLPTCGVAGARLGLRNRLLP
jgi:Tfp pilus assembly protein PilX